MSVHNGERFLGEAIECILAQTLTDLEFIIIDDGSSDATPDIVARYAAQDRRIVSVRRENKGLTKSLNEALSIARGKYVARQDADDISQPHRLSTMVGFLEANSSIAAAGSWVETIDAEGRTTGRIADPTGHDEIAWAMIGYNAIIHPSAAIRRDCIVRFGGYDEGFTYAQDYELWTRWIRLGARVANIPDTLVRYRRGPQQISHRFLGTQSALAVRAATAYIEFLLADTVKQQQVLGLRQVIGFSDLDEDAVGALPILTRLAGQPVFEAALKSSPLRARAASRLFNAVRESRTLDRTTAIAGLFGAVRLWNKMLLKRWWWTCLASQLSPNRAQVPSRSH